MSIESKHEWEMINTKIGYIIYENSYPNRHVRCYFSEEEVEPIEEYKEGEEFWNYAGSAQSLKFNLKCNKTGKVLEFDELMGIMYPDGEKCEGDISVIQKIAESFQIFTYIAICYRGPKGEEIELSDEKLLALNEYFNCKLKTPGKKILILPERLCGQPGNCFGQMLVDVGLTLME